jgi:hypothetical protein
MPLATDLFQASHVALDSRAQAIRIDAQTFAHPEERERAFVLIRVEPFRRFEEVRVAAAGFTAIAILDVESDRVLEHREEKFALAFPGQLSAAHGAILRWQDADSLENAGQVVRRCMYV